ncbi:MAG TPA: glycosyltransferase [Candidatus Dormibacteraeota bacterium]|nr:glycosyltransferase [Candidatus Dormibacteraeota bacterium]
MKILLVHNTYQHQGGEDVILREESRLLESHGHVVIHYERDNDELRGRSGLGALAAAGQTVWSFSSYGAVNEILKKEKPDLAHFHNTFPLISPSAYYACAKEGVPVVQTLHNYRLLCPAASMVRDGKVCESCLGRAIPWPGVVHACYRGSRPATLATAAMLAVHRALRTYREKVNVYIALSEFARGKFIEGGLPADRIVVKSNFVADRTTRQASRGDYALFVGRLSEEKGPQLLPTAWQAMKSQIPLRIVGDGPLWKPLREDIERDGLALRIELMGRRSPDEVASLIGGARVLIAPSICYETFGLTVVEAYSCGRPVIVSRIGALAEIVQDGVTGLHFEPGNAADLAAKVEWAWNHPDAMAEMGRAARREYEAKYTPEINYQILMRIYEQATAAEA